MAVQQYEPSIIFSAALLKADSENPATPPAALSAQPQPPITLQSKHAACAVNI